MSDWTPPASDARVSSAWQSPASDEPRSRSQYLAKTAPAMTRMERFGTGLRDPLEGGAQLLSHIVPAPVERAVTAANNWLADRTGLVARLPEGGMDEYERQREASIQAGEKAAGVEGTDWWRAAGNATATLPLSRLGPVTGGAAMGALTPVTDGDFTSEKLKQIAVGAAGGKVGEMGVNALARVVAPAAKRVISAAAQQARDAGYVLPPSMIGGKIGPIVAALGGGGGKIKLQQAASAKNQEVTNRLAAKALGLPEDATLTPHVLNDVRAKAGKAYEAIANAVPSVKIDDQFRQEINQIAGKGSQAAEHFPDLMDNPQLRKLRDGLVAVKRDPTGRILPATAAPPGAWLDLVRQLRFKGSQNLKAIGDPEKHALGLAQRQAADSIDGMMERNLSKLGKPALVDAYRDARKLIAKAHDVETVTNPATGDVSAHGLAKLADKGRPLSGELGVIADTANAFPKAVQETSRFGGNEAHSAVDFFGSALALGHGNPSVAGAIMARPLVRNFLLSKMMQNRIAPSSTSLASHGTGSIFTPAARNHLAEMLRKGAPYAAPAGAALAQQGAGP